MGAGVDSSDFETFNFNSLCQNLKEAFQKAPGTSSHIMWAHLPDFRSQIQFYEIIKIQTNIPENTFEIVENALKMFENTQKNMKTHFQKL